MAEDRMTQALQYLNREFSVNADEFLRDNAPGGEMLLMGALSKGYAREAKGRFGLTDAGRAKIAAEVVDG